MPKLTESAPKYRHHKASGRAVVTLGGQDFYLGPWKTPASRLKYDQIVGEWLAHGHNFPQDPSHDLTIVEIASAYWQFCQGYYLRQGRPSPYLATIRVAIRTLTSAYGEQPIRQFGPTFFRAFQQRLVDAGHARVYVNKLVDVIRRMIKWAVSRDLLPVAIHQALATVPGLRKGRTEAPERPRVLPISRQAVETTLQQLAPIVQDMVRLQLLTGARPAEICLLRPCDLETSDAVWKYRPEFHKSDNYGRERVILIGPEGQKILAPYLQRSPTEYCFAPSESERQRNAARRAERQTPLSPSQSSRRAKARPKRAPGEHYDSSSYRRAIHRACDRAWPIPEGLDVIEAEQWRKAHRWSPNRLRHTAATEIRQRFGLEAAQAMLGHASADVSLIYAERDLKLAARVASTIG